MILTDREIKISLERGLIKIEPAPKDVAFSSTAVDLTLDSTIRYFKPDVVGIDVIIDPSKEGANSEQTLAALTDPGTIPEDGYLLEPQKFLLAWTVEYVWLQTTARLAARVEGKSSLARLGISVHVTAPTIHAGFEGQIQLEVVNHGVKPIRLRTGMRICQLIFEATLGTPDKGYQGQFWGQTSDDF